MSISDLYAIYRDKSRPKAERAAAYATLMDMLLAARRPS